MAITIKDIAALAGVSKTTVSKIIICLLEINFKAIATSN